MRKELDRYKDISYRDVLTKYPKELGNWISNSHKDWYGFELLVENKPGVIYRVGEEFAKRNINIVLFTHSNAKADEAVIFLVADFSKSNLNIEDIIGTLSKWRFIKEIRRAEYADNMYFSSKMFPILLNGVRVVLFGPANIYGLIIQLRKNLGEEMATNVLHHMGYAIGSKTFEIYFKSRGYTIDEIESVMKLLHAVLVAYGWGRVYKWNYNGIKNELVLEIEDLWECEVLRDNNLNKGSSYFKGALEGFFSSLFGQKIVVKEVACISKGDSICKYVIRVI